MRLVLGVFVTQGKTVLTTHDLGEDSLIFEIEHREIKYSLRINAEKKIYFTDTFIKGANMEE